MALANINIKINTKDDNINKNISGIINNNRIVYIDDNIKTSIIIDKTIKMTRECIDYKIEFIFDLNNITTGKYVLNAYNKIINLKINTYSIIIKDNSIYLEYQLYMGEEDMGIFKFNLNYEIS